VPEVVRHLRVEQKLGLPPGREMGVLTEEDGVETLALGPASQLHRLHGVMRLHRADPDVHHVDPASSHQFGRMTHRRDHMIVGAWRRMKDVSS